MGTRINVLFENRLVDWTDREESLRVVSKALPAAQQLASYWMDSGPGGSSEIGSWVAEPPFPPPYTREYYRYSGPGPLFVEISPFVVRVRSGGRWQGFLSIQPLRALHIRAFRSVAVAFAASSARVYRDDDLVNDAFWDGGDLNFCLAVLERRFGKPVPLQEQLDPYVAGELDTGWPARQYEISIP